MEKNKVNRQKYQQLAVEVRKRRPGYRVEVIPTVIECMGEGVGVMRKQVRKILINRDTEKVCREMLRTTVMELESMQRKFISNIVIGD